MTKEHVPAMLPTPTAWQAFFCALVREYRKMKFGVRSVARTSVNARIRFTIFDYK